MTGFFNSPTVQTYTEFSIASDGRDLKRELMTR